MRDAYRVYAIVRSGISLPAASTIAGEELLLVPCRELSAVAGRAHADARVTVEAAMHHEAVVEAVRRQASALPVRFGTMFSGSAPLASAIAERYDSLAADLDRLGDKVEMSLTALWTPHADTGTSAAAADGEAELQGAGARYLRSRAGELQREEARRTLARDVAEELDDAVGAYALARRVSLLPSARVAMRAAYLMSPDGVLAFTRAFERTPHSRGELHVALTGPWPPYSFVSEPAGAPRRQP